MKKTHWRSNLYSNSFTCHAIFQNFSVGGQFRADRPAGEEPRIAEAEQVAGSGEFEDGEADQGIEEEDWGRQFDGCAGRLSYTKMLNFLWKPRSETFEFAMNYSSETSTNYQITYFQRTAPVPNIRSIGNISLRWVQSLGLVSSNQITACKFIFHLVQNSQFEEWT